MGGGVTEGLVLVPPTEWEGHSSLDRRQARGSAVREDGAKASAMATGLHAKDPESRMTITVCVWGGARVMVSPLS